MKIKVRGGAEMSARLSTDNATPILTLRDGTVATPDDLASRGGCVVQATEREREALRAAGFLLPDCEAVSAAAAVLGARGGAAGKGISKRRSTSFNPETARAAGAAGTGDAKRRPREHYARMSRISDETRSRLLKLRGKKSPAEIATLLGISKRTVARYLATTTTA